MKPVPLGRDGVRLRPWLCIETAHHYRQDCTGIMAQSKIESFSSEQYAPHSRNNLGGKLFGDLFSAAFTATLVAPSVTVIDRQVVGRLLFWFEMESDQL